MAYRFTVRFEKLLQSYSNLEKIHTLEWPEDETLYGFIWCGVISKFCITFDLAYKLAKDVLIEYHGIQDFAKGSPREILKAAYQANIIKDETWLEMLQDRNAIVHEYQDLESVHKWCEKITEKYLPLINDLIAYTKKIITE